MTTMRKIFEGFQVTQGMMVAAAMSQQQRSQGLSGRVAKIEQAARDLEAADPKRGAKALKALEAISRAVDKAEAFFSENRAPRILLLYTDGSGNKHTIIVTGTDVNAYNRGGDSGIPESLSTFMRGGGGYEQQSRTFRDALLGAYRASKGDANEVLKAARDVSGWRNQEAWQIKSVM